MKRFLLIVVLLLAALPVMGELVAKNKDTGGTLRLQDSACSHAETLAILREEWRPKFKNARILNSKGFIEFYGCWIEHDGDTAMVILQDGAALAIPLAAFKDPTV